MVSIRWSCLISFVENKSYIDGFVLAISKVAEIKFLTEEVDPKIEDDSIGGERRGREISESRLVHILHNNIRICVVPQIQRSLGPFANVIFQSQNFILTSCSTSPTWFLIKKKNLSSNLNNQFYSPHFLDQSPGRLIKVSAERSGANWKEGTLSRHLYYSEATNLYWLRFSSSFIVIDKVAQKQMFFLSNKVRDGELGPVRGEGRGGEGDWRQDFIRGGRLKRNI